jgi:KDO2-lipid IV(A) lauroyltransferase
VPQFYLVPKRLARKAPILVAIVQWFEARTFRFIFWLIQRLSIRHAGQLLAFGFGLFGPHGDKAQKAKANLAIAFPESSEQWRAQTSRKIFRYLGVSTVELIKLQQIWEQREQRLEFELHPTARDHLAAKGATVFVSAHVGAWQITTLLGLHMGLTNSTVFAPESNPALRDIMLGLRHSMGVKLIPSDAGVRPLMKELMAGHSIGIAMDTRLDTGKLIPYFGRDALTNTTAARLALRTGAALIPIRAVRLPGERYRVIVYEPLVSQCPEASVNDQAAELSASINAHFEDWIREQPDQWICLKRRWPKGHKL